MVFENKIFKRVPHTAEKFTLNDYCLWNGVQILQCNTRDDVSREVCEVSKCILLNYTKFSDMLAFFATALNQSASTLRYKLTPPYTTSKLDCEHICNLLAKIKVLSDVSYSSISCSFLIEVNPTNVYSISDLLNIGLSELLACSSDNDIETIYNANLYCKETAVFADVVHRHDKKLTLLHIETAVGLEADIASHSRQFERLVSKLFQSRITCHDIDEFYIVTPYVAKLLPPLNSIVPIDQIQELAIRLSK